jgi:DNA-binding NarL/FixJ family response regulator
VPVVVVSGMEDRATVMRTLDLGAKAFLPKSADSSRIRSAIEALLDGRIYLPDSIVSGAGQGDGGGGRGADDWNLTDRQREVLALVVAACPTS